VSTGLQSHLLGLESSTVRYDWDAPGGGAVSRQMVYDSGLMTEIRITKNLVDAGRESYVVKQREATVCSCLCKL
jgi:hypothetical protein